MVGEDLAEDTEEYGMVRLLRCYITPDSLVYARAQIRQDCYGLARLITARMQPLMDQNEHEITFPALTKRILRRRFWTSQEEKVPGKLRRRCASSAQGAARKMLAVLEGEGWIRPDDCEDYERFRVFVWGRLELECTALQVNWEKVYPYYIRVHVLLAHAVHDGSGEDRCPKLPDGPRTPKEVKLLSLIQGRRLPLPQPSPPEQVPPCYSVTDSSLGTWTALCKYQAIKHVIM